MTQDTEYKGYRIRSEHGSYRIWAETDAARTAYLEASGETHLSHGYIGEMDCDIEDIKEQIDEIVS